MNRLGILVASLALGSLVAMAPGADPSFPGVSGDYGGIIEAPEGEDPANSGIVTIGLMDTGAATIKVVWQGESYAFKQVFAGNSESGGTLERELPKKNPAAAGAVLTVSCNLSADNRMVTGTISDPDVSATGSFTLSGEIADPALTAQLDPGLRISFIDPPAGSSSLAFAPRGDASEIPADGFSVVNVGKSAKRNTRVVGGLPDSEKFSTGSPLRGVNYALRTGLYPQKNKKSGGQLLGTGTVSATGGPASLIAGLRWNKRSGLATNQAYPGAIDNRVNLDTVSYNRNRDLRFVLTGAHEAIASNARIRFTRGNLSGERDPITANLSVTIFGAKIVGPNPDKIKIKATPLTGGFNGSFIHPDTREKVKFKGAFRSFFGFVPGEGRGNFLSRPDSEDPTRSESGSVRITIQ